MNLNKLAKKQYSNVSRLIIKCKFELFKQRFLIVNHKQIIEKDELTYLIKIY